MNKSVLLEIAKESDPIRQDELWQQAQAGELTVRQARAGKKLPAKAKGAKATIRLPEATVVIRFRVGEETPERVGEMLELALSLLRSEHLAALKAP